MFEVGQIHAIHAEGPETSVANRTAVLDSLRYAKRTVVSRPGSLVSSKNIFLVFFFLTESLTGHPPPRNFLDIRRVRQIRDHDPVAERPRVIFQPQLAVPPAARPPLLPPSLHISLWPLPFSSPLPSSTSICL